MSVLDFSIRRDMPNREYHASEGISKSGLDAIAVSPAHYKYGRSSISPDTARIGTAFHKFLLEDGKGLIVPPNMTRRSKADKQDWAEWMDEHGADPEIPFNNPAADWFPLFEEETGITVLTENEFDVARDMAFTARQNSVADKLITDGTAEQSMFATYQGVKCRIRPDFVPNDGHIIVDLKTAADASRRAFRMSCAKYRYHVQHAFYSQIYYEVTGQYPEFYFVVIEKSPPYSCVVYKLGDEAVQNGQWLMDRDLATYKRCMESGEWPSHENDLDLDIPIFEEETFDIFIDGMEVAV